MNSDSESQDSDDGRRFRFESTRKDTASLATTRRKISPQPRRRYSRSRSRSHSWDRSSRYSKDDRRSRSSVDRETNNKKDKNSKSNIKEKKKHHKDSHRSKDSDKHKNKHKKHSRERSRERTNLNEENQKRKEEKSEPAAEKIEKRKDEETSKRKEESATTTNDRKSEKQKDEGNSKRKEESTTTTNDRKSAKQKDEGNSKRKEESTTTTNDRKSEKQKDEGNSKRKEESSVTNGQKRKDSDKVNEKSAEKTREEYNKLVISDEMRADAVAPTRKRPKSFFERVVNKKAIEEDTSYYGPTLPPQLEKKLLNVREREDTEQSKVVKKLPSLEKDEPQNIGPALSPNLSAMEEDESECIGPALPSHLLASSQRNDDEEKMETDEVSTKEDSEEEDTFGPPLPPHLQKRKVVGPVLPDNFVIGELTTDVSSLSPNAENDEINSDDDDDVVGPLPPDHPAAQNQAQMLLEYRALQLQAKFRDKTTPEEKKREEWMTELPPAHAVALGLGSIPRTFRTKEGPDMSDRSMWTDTPADRLRKQKEKEENRFVPSKESGKKSKKSKDEEAVSKEPVEETRAESLLDMHLKSLKKKKKKMEKEAKEQGLPTRRPFDRDVDLQANRLDEARKKKIFEKASRLNDRFSAAKML